MDLFEQTKTKTNACDVCIMVMKFDGWQSILNVDVLTTVHLGSVRNVPHRDFREHFLSATLN